MNDVLLAIDTATSRATLVLGSPTGVLLATDTWPGAHAHAETLLPRLAALLAGAGVGLGAISGVVVGIGPGGFTGLRVGLATAKTLAHGLGRPIVGIGTGAALAEATGAAGTGIVLLPAGPRDRYLVPVGEEGEGPGLLSPASLGAWLVAPGHDAGTLIAVDLEDPDIPESARRLGVAALDGLGPALLRLGAVALRAGRTDDVAALVPAYVTLPRGVVASTEGATWSPDLR